jgi:L-arabinokinase
MWRVIKQDAVSNPYLGNLPDVSRFLNRLNQQADFFDPNLPIYVGRAPGRLDLMGGIADYSGSLVLELPLGIATFVAVQATSESVFEIISIRADSDLPPLTSSLSLENLLACSSYEAAHHLLTADPETSWQAYIAGILFGLLYEKVISPPAQGVKLLVYSEVPDGKGVSSSAALEVATLQALAGLYSSRPGGREAALLCQKVENLAVGAPCGIMDQMSSACGEAGSLLALLCQPAELQASVALPGELEVWGIDSGLRHAVSGADYGSVRVGAFMGYRIIAELAGFRIEAKGAGRVTVRDTRWGGYLANLSPSEWESYYRDKLPVTLSGAEFLARYTGFTDPVTRIDPHRTYQVRQATAHPIYENHRVRLFRELLQSQPVSEESLQLLGELMYQSHASYSQCGLGSSGTDRLVELVQQVGPTAGVYGAKITGGGSGGMVAVLVRQGEKKLVQKIAEQYRLETGYPISIVGGSSPGAVQFGILQLRKLT